MTDHGSRLLYVLGTDVPVPDGEPTPPAPGSPSAGRATVDVIPTASAYLRYVSIEAMTTRASTVIKSMPTSEILTHASTTMPLSRIRSRTSIGEVATGVSSRAYAYLSFISARLTLEGCYFYLTC